MADEDTNQNQGGNQGGTSTGTGDGTDWKAETDKWKGLARKHEDQAKTNKAELDKLQQANDSSKSDMDKLREEVAKLTKQAQESERKALIAEVAQDKGLTVKQARRLTGSTREELESDADDLISEFGIDKKSNSAGDGGGDTSGQQDADTDDTSGSSSGSSERKPKSAPKDPNAAGGTGGGGEEKFDPKKAADDILGDA